MKRKLIGALSASLAAIGLATAGFAQSAAQQHPQIVEEFGGPANAQVSNYVRNVGARIAAQTGRPGRAPAPYTVTALNSPALNAFAVPGGYVYVTRQLLGLVNDEAELASVLGHEIAHIAANHHGERKNRSIWSQLGAVLIGTVTGSQQVAQLASQLGQGILLSYSRNQEFEADNLGVGYIASAGYDPMAAASLLSSLGAATALDDRLNGRDQRSIPNWARSHPLSEDRVRRASSQAQRYRRPGAVARNRDQYLAVIDGMLYGDDPQQGMIEGQQFLHPILRLKFTAPTGYGIQNGARTVTISGNGGQAQFAGGVSNGNLGGYIGQVLQTLGGRTRINYPTPRSTTVNGLPVAYTTTRVQSQQGQVDVSVFAYQWDNSRAYHFVTITRAGSGLGPFGSMVTSLARMSASEAARIRPRVIDVVNVRPGDTIQSLAGRMAYNDYRLERFLTLNGMGSNSALTPGQKAKLVVYGS